MAYSDEDYEREMDNMKPVPGFIPEDQLTDMENYLMTVLLVAFYDAGNVCNISEERTEKAREILKQEDCDDQETDRLFTHFNAVTEMINSASPAFQNRAYEVLEEMIPEMKEALKNEPKPN